MEECAKEELKMNKWNEIIKFDDKYFPNWRSKRELIFMSNALAGETGEVCGIIKSFYGGGTKEKPRPTLAEIMEEVIDVIIYLVLFSECLGYNEDLFDIAFM